MRLTKWSDFPFYRDLCVASRIRQGASIAGTLRMTRSELVSTNADDVLYVQLRDAMFPESPMAYPTEGGAILRPKKFSAHLAKMTHYAGLGSIPGNPRGWSVNHFNQLAFWVNRQRHQVIFAGAFCAWCGLRPSEVATLRCSDVFLHEKLIRLRDTKSGVDQTSALPDEVHVALARFCAHLGRADPLFVTRQGMMWNAGHVRAAVRQIGAELGYNDLTPRRLRSSVGTALARAGEHVSIIQSQLRHRDPGTSLKYYVYVELDENRRALNRLGKRS